MFNSSSLLLEADWADFWFPLNRPHVCELFFFSLDDFKAILFKIINAIFCIYIYFRNVHWISETLLLICFYYCCISSNAKEKKRYLHYILPLTNLLVKYFKKPISVDHCLPRHNLFCKLFLVYVIRHFKFTEKLFCKVIF